MNVENEMQTPVNAINPNPLRADCWYGTPLHRSEGGSWHDLDVQDPAAAKQGA